LEYIFVQSVNILAPKQTVSVFVHLPFLLEALMKFRTSSATFATRNPWLTASMLQYYSTNCIVLSIAISDNYSFT